MMSGELNSVPVDSARARDMARLFPEKCNEALHR
jgi:hypothetical protein